VSAEVGLTRGGVRRGAHGEEERQPSGNEREGDQAGQHGALRRSAQDGVLGGLKAD
jgi:hypothetical protein